MQVQDVLTTQVWTIEADASVRESASWPDQLGDPSTRTGADIDGRVGNDWGVHGVPETVVVDERGMIRHKIIAGELWLAEVRGASLALGEQAEVVAIDGLWLTATGPVQTAGTAAEPVAIAGAGASGLAAACACHDAKLEGQPNWRSHLPNALLPATAARGDRAHLASPGPPAFCNHEDSVRRAKSVGCSPGRAKAWNEPLLRDIEPTAVPDCDTPVEKLVALGRSLGSSSTPTWFVVTSECYNGAIPHDNTRHILDDASRAKGAK